jgi:hypothetical protein
MLFVQIFLTVGKGSYIIAQSLFFIFMVKV